MSKQDKTAAYIGIILVMTAFGAAANIWGIRQAVELAITVSLVYFYIEFAIYLFAKSSLVLKVIAVFLYPLVVLTLFMPISLRRRVKEIGALKGRDRN
ncbi:MAG: hypothetical protein R6X06_00165 [Gammaproteobacteria bacterium]